MAVCAGTQDGAGEEVEGFVLEGGGWRERLEQAE